MRAACRPCSLKALADLFALDRIHSDIIFRNDDYIAPEKVGQGRGSRAACMWQQERRRRGAVARCTTPDGTLPANAAAAACRCQQCPPPLAGRPPAHPTLAGQGHPAADRGAVQRAARRGCAPGGFFCDTRPHSARAHRPQVGLVLGCVRCWGAAGVARGGCGALFKRFPMQEDTGLAVSDGRSSGTCFAVLQTAMGHPLPVPPRLAELKLHSAPALPAVLPPLPPPVPPAAPLPWTHTARTWRPRALTAETLTLRAT